MFIGAHVSVASGLAEAASYAASVGCECMQIFAKSPRRWHARPLDPAAGAGLAAACEKHGIRAVFTHAAYLINLGTLDDALLERSVDALADELVRARMLGARGVAVHLGTDPERRPEAAAERIAAAVDEVFARAGMREPVDGPRLLLENSAGAGTTYGRTVAEIGAVFERSGSPGLLGVCLDTCHAHASGIDLSSETAWRRVIAEIEATCGPDALRLIHANDCLSELGGNRDRHAWIGEGTLGEEGFEAMFAALGGSEDLSVVVEMPGEVPVKDAENVGRLKRLRDGL